MFESESFNIGENTLLEIEKQGQVPATTPKLKPVQINCSELFTKSINLISNENKKPNKSISERFKSATQKAKNRRKLEKSKSSASLSTDLQNEQSAHQLSSITKYLQAEEIDFSAWENSAAKLISPAVQSRKYKSENLLEVSYQVSRDRANLTEDIFSQIPEENELSFSDFDTSGQELNEQLLQDSASERILNESKNVDLPSIENKIQTEDIDFSEWELSAAELIESKIFENSTNDSMATGDTSALDLIDNILSRNPSHDLSYCLEPNCNEASTHEDFVQAWQKQKSFLESSNNDSVINSQRVPRESFLQNQTLQAGNIANLHLVSNWNLPSSVVNEYKKKGVIEMFEWQVQALNNPKVLFEGCNLVYSAPTSAGKTLVSEILMIKNIVERKKKSLFVVPFVSIVREKMFYLRVS